MTKLGKLKAHLRAEWLGSEQELEREAIRHAVQEQNDQEARMSLARLQAKILREAPKAPRISQPQVTQDDTGVCEVVLPQNRYMPTVVVFRGPLHNYWREVLGGK